MLSRNNKARILKLAARAGASRKKVHSRYGTRLRLGAYVADIIPDREDHPFIHHWIVQRVDSPKILYLGQEASFAEALERGHKWLEKLARDHKKKQGAIYEFATAHALRAGSTAAQFPARAPSSGLQRQSLRHSSGAVPGRNK
jgi:hypothetical protein